MTKKNADNKKDELHSKLPQNFEIHSTPKRPNTQTKKPK